MLCQGWIEAKQVFFCQNSSLLKPKVVAQLTFMPLVEDGANLLDDVVVKLDEVVGTNLRPTDDNFDKFLIRIEIVLLKLTHLDVAVIKSLGLFVKCL